MISKIQPIHIFHSMDGFINGLAYKNHYPKRAWLLDKMGIPSQSDPNLISSESALHRLEEFCLIDKQRLLGMTMHQFIPIFLTKEKIEHLHITRWNTQTFPIWDAEIEQSFYRRRSSKFCPLCYDEFRTKLLLWNLVPVTTCKNHKCLLIDRCPVCQSKMLNFAAGSCSNCGTPINKMAVKSIIGDPSLEALSNTIHSMLQWNNEDNINKSLINRFLTPPTYFSFLYNFGKILLVYDREDQIWNETTFQSTGFSKYFRIANLNLYSVTQLMRAANDLLLNWPESFYRAVDRIAWGEHKRYKNAKRAPLSFPSRMHIAFPLDEFKWLWSTWAHYVKNEAGKDTLPYNWLRYAIELPADNPGQNEFVSLTQAAKTLNVHPTTLKKEIESGNIKVRENKNIKSRKIVLFSEETIQQIQDKKNGKLSIYQTAAYLGVNHNVVKKLSSIGLIQNENRAFWPMSKWFFKQEDLDGLICNIEIHAIQKSTPSIEFYDLYQAVKVIYLPDFGIADLIKEIVLEKIPAYWDSEKIGLSRFWLYRVDVDSYRDSLVFPNKEYNYSIHEALSILGMDKRSLAKLCAAKLIMPLNTQVENINLWIFSKNEIDTFNARFISAEDAAIIIGFSERAVLAWIKKGALKPVSGKEINSSHQYLFDREYVVEWRKNRLLSEEVLALLGIARRTLESWISKGFLVPIKDMGEHPIWFDCEQVQAIKDSRDESTVADRQIAAFLQDISNHLEKEHLEFVPFTDEQWRLIEPFFPVNTKVYAKKPRESIDLRKILDVILEAAYRMKSLRQMPNSNPSGRTCTRRLMEWVQAGKLDAIRFALISILSVTSNT